MAALGAENIYGQLGFNALGTALQGLGRFEELIEELEDATHLIREEDLPGPFPGTDMVLRVGSAYRSLGRHAEASPFYERAALAMLARRRRAAGSRTRSPSRAQRVGSSAHAARAP